MTWRKSTASADGNCCVWVDIQPDVVLVQGDEHGGPMLKFTHPEWAAFIAGVKAGEFDLELTHG